MSFSIEVKVSEDSGLIDLTEQSKSKQWTETDLDAWLEVCSERLVKCVEVRLFKAAYGNKTSWIRVQVQLE